MPSEPAHELRGWIVVEIQGALDERSGLEPVAVRGRPDLRCISETGSHSSCAMAISTAALCPVRRGILGTTRPRASRGWSFSTPARPCFARRASCHFSAASFARSRARCLRKADAGAPLVMTARRAPRRRRGNTVGQIWKPIDTTGGSRSSRQNAGLYHHRFQTGDVMAEGKNLLERLPDLTVEDLEAIAGAVGVGPSGLLTKYRYYRDAARDPVYIGLLDYEVVIDKLRDLLFWPQARSGGPAGVPPISQDAAQRPPRSNNGRGLYRFFEARAGPSSAEIERKKEAHFGGRGSNSGTRPANVRRTLLASRAALPAWAPQTVTFPKSPKQLQPPQGHP